jgi:hypothetical protein
VSVTLTTSTDAATIDHQIRDLGESVGGSWSRMRPQLRFPVIGHSTLGL